MARDLSFFSSWRARCGPPLSPVSCMRCRTRTGRLRLPSHSTPVSCSSRRHRPRQSRKLQPVRLPPRALRNRVPSCRRDLHISLTGPPKSRRTSPHRRLRAKCPTPIYRQPRRPLQRTPRAPALPMQRHNRRRAGPPHKQVPLTLVTVPPMPLSSHCPSCQTICVNRGTRRSHWRAFPFTPTARWT